MLLWLLVAALVALGNATNSSAGGLGESNCRTPDGRDGHCILASQCASLSDLSSAERRRFVCGYRGPLAKLCCGPEPQAAANSTEVVSRGAGAGGAAIAPVPSEPLPADYPSALPAGCGLSTVSDSRVVGGRVADVGAWPWMAAIYLKTEAQPKVGCGGALITDRHVLTAAHCVSVGARARQLPARVLTVRLGDHDLNSSDDHTSPVDVQVSDVVRHPRYDRRTYANDIAVLVLSKAVTWNRFVQPVCLPFGPLASNTLEGNNAFIVGWGATKFNGAGSSELRQAQIPVWAEADCKKAYEQHLPIGKAQLCAGDVRAEMDSCQGDSGGPLLLPHEGRYYVVGIVSSGKDCATPGFPGIYTRVSSHLDWLRNELGAAQ
ncbi:venom protease-like isoform X2 [Amblyomma americanum]